MTAEASDEADIKLLKAVEYMLKEHGDGAIAEAEAALKHAKHLNDNATVDVFSDILSTLTEQTFRTNALVRNECVSTDEARSLSSATGLSDPSAGG